MPHKNNCKNCGETFFGRLDQKYCSSHCRNEINNRKKRTERKYIDSDVQSFLKNREIINRLLRKKIESRGRIKYVVLKVPGFNLQGPFKISENSDDNNIVYHVGDYDLTVTEDAFLWERRIDVYELE